MKTAQSKPQEMTRGQAAGLNAYLRIGYWTEQERAAIIAQFAREMQEGAPQPLTYEDERGGVTLRAGKDLFELTMFTSSTPIKDRASTRRCGAEGTSARRGAKGLM